jgi:hypothetical protein
LITAKIGDDVRLYLLYRRNEVAARRDARARDREEERHERNRRGG